ncbi:putative phosphoglycerate mutase [Hamadaea flava]|uniref:Histidine phosphatase family protein n=1 Tax=Hamadaea flava TaxID=1742688 RepID=A0ABV8LYR4_9ACTN|nr:histidine phosphatase family protein [Hamadaea flava]MCP2322084.1 putative phosphoglycerate mutase [Hamadaea flava]
MGELILVRHGETEWSRTGQYAGRTDIPMTEAGRAAVGRLAPVFAARPVTAAYASPADRAVQSAALIGLPGVRTDEDLWEWDYGGYEGLTEQQIEATRPGWDLWRDGVIPGDSAHPGESVEQVGARIDAVLGRVEPLLAGGDVVLVLHGHLQRVLAARWLGLPPEAGRLFAHPHTATISILTSEHDRPVLGCWNVRADSVVGGQ